MDTTATKPEQASLEGLVTRQGSLAKVYPLFNPETLQQADERSVERHTNEDLRDVYGWTANVSIYTLEKNSNTGQDEAVLYFGGRDVFNTVIGKNLTEVTSQLINNKNYVPNSKDIEAVVNSSLKIKIADLELEEHNSEWGYFKIDTSDVKGEKLNDAQRAFAEKVYGSLQEKTDEESGETYTDFSRTMVMLKDSEIETTKIYTLTSDYVKSNVGENSSALARACWLDYFDGNSDFYAENRDVIDNYGSVRGVLSPEATAPKVLEETTEQPDYKGALDLLTGSPKEDILKHLDEKARLSLLNLVTESYNAETK